MRALIAPFFHAFAPEERRPMTSFHPVFRHLWLVASFVLFALAALAAPCTVAALSVPPLTAHVNDYAGSSRRTRSGGWSRSLPGSSRPIRRRSWCSLFRASKERTSRIFHESCRGLEGGAEGDRQRRNPPHRERRTKGENRSGTGTGGQTDRPGLGPYREGQDRTRFRAGDFDAGVRDGVSAIIEVVRGEYKADGRTSVRGRAGVPPILTLLIFLFIALVFAGSISKVLGAATGAVGLPIAAKLAFSSISLPILGGLAAVGLAAGLLLHVVFSGEGPVKEGAEVPGSEASAAAFSAAVRQEGTRAAAFSEEEATLAAEGLRVTGNIEGAEEVYR